MAAVLDLSPVERDMELLWRTFHRAWVAASDELARAEADLAAERDPMLRESKQALVRMLQRHESHARAVLERFEARAREFRSRTAAFRARYV